jgi:hypothetical protein
VSHTTSRTDDTPPNKSAVEALAKPVMTVLWG